MILSRSEGRNDLEGKNLSENRRDSVLGQGSSVRKELRSAVPGLSHVSEVKHFGSLGREEECCRVRASFENGGRFRKQLT